MESDLDKESWSFGFDVIETYPLSTPYPKCWEEAWVTKNKCIVEIQNGNDHNFK